MPAVEPAWIIVMQHGNWTKSWIGWMDGGKGRDGNDLGTGFGLELEMYIMARGEL